MLDRQRTLGTIGRLLTYPNEQYIEAAELLYVIMQTEMPEAARALSAFGQFVEGLELYELEEAYTRTFDINPACALEIGWHLFGEEYVRGQFLVRMRQELARFQICESAELPDHVTHVLAVVAAMPEDDAKYFVHACVQPAVEKMRTALTEKESPFAPVVDCLALVFDDLFGPAPVKDETDEAGQPTETDPLRGFPMPTEMDIPAEGVANNVCSGGDCGGGGGCGSDSHSDSGGGESDIPLVQINMNELTGDALRNGNPSANGFNTH